MRISKELKGDRIKQLVLFFLYFISGSMLVIGNLFPILGFSFYIGLLIISYLILKGYIFRFGIYAFVLPYFLILGFVVWNYVFPYYTGVILSLLLAELFGRLLFKILTKMQNTVLDFIALPISFFIFDFAFQKISILSFLNIVPLLAPLYNHSFLLNLASICGAQMALIFIMLFISCAIKIIISKKALRNVMIIGGICSVFILLPSLLSIEFQSDSNLPKNIVKIAVVQGSIPKLTKLDYSEKVCERLEYYVGLAAMAKADITVFPEIEFGLYDTQNIIDQGYRYKFIDAANKVGGTAVFTVTEGNSITKSKEERYLSAILVHDGYIMKTTRKRNLVPFSEARRYTRGKEYNIYETKYGKLGISICYDANSRTIEKLKRNGAELVLAPFNDSSFGKGYHNIHRYYLVMKAAECSIPIAAANEDGISQIIDSRGIVLTQIAYKNKERVEYLVNVTQKDNLYMKIGVYTEWIVMILLVSILVFRIRICYKTI